MPIPFTKMNGAGNDFIIIDHREPFLVKNEMAELARLVCRRRFSIGADGLILIGKDPRVDFCWHFYNADGSLAEMCGNGARCAARFAYDTGIAPAAMRFQTAAGVIEAEIIGAAVKIKMTPPTDRRLEQQITVNDRQITVHHINTGVPHVVVFVDDINLVPVMEMGRAIRNHPIYQPAGANVNFVEMRGEHMYARTYERGVEGETMACGTGAVAAALIAAHTRQALSPARVITAGGDSLYIHFCLNKDGDADNVYLEGPALTVCEGRLMQGALFHEQCHDKNK
ncbi:MAG: diaminopimelate epimerase [Deltaproteobacteria bacterium]|nr:diaminopimelate epimerase [Deltaproteobacteria bacterium]